jgi:hypothetical protein
VRDEPLLVGVPVLHFWQESHNMSRKIKRSI